MFFFVVDNEDANATELTEPTQERGSGLYKRKLLKSELNLMRMVLTYELSGFFNYDQVAFFKSCIDSNASDNSIKALFRAIRKRFNDNYTKEEKEELFKQWSLEGIELDEKGAIIPLKKNEKIKNIGKLYEENKNLVIEENKLLKIKAVESEQNFKNAMTTLNKLKGLAPIIEDLENAKFGSKEFRDILGGFVVKKLLIDLEDEDTKKKPMLYASITSVLSTLIRHDFETSHDKILKIIELNKNYLEAKEAE